ncbi:MAG: hypothetical protein ACMUJM_16835 [bacterium]
MPKDFLVASEGFLAEELKTAIKDFIELKGKFKDIFNIINRATKWGITIQSPEIEKIIEDGILYFIKRLLHYPFQITIIQAMNSLLEISSLLKYEFNLFAIQNLFFKILALKLPELDHADLTHELKKKILVEYRKASEKLLFSKNIEKL